MSVKILLAEDEMALGAIIKESLETRDFEVEYCENGEKAFQSFQESPPDLLILDVMMPVMDGLKVAAEIRKYDTKTPIIFLTAKSQVKDVVAGFDSGGNDYIRKPFSMEELIVRIRALLQRVRAQEKETALAIGNYIFNKVDQTLIFNKQVQHLTYKETELLYHLYEKRNAVLDRMLILKKLWGEDDFFNARSMDVFITKLRKKLKEDESVRIINIRGLGYKLVCNP